MGPGTRDKEGSFIPATVKEGDTVLLPEYGGTEVKLGDKEYVYIFHRALLLKYLDIHFLCLKSRCNFSSKALLS